MLYGLLWLMTRLIPLVLLLRLLSLILLESLLMRWLLSLVPRLILLLLRLMLLLLRLILLLALLIQRATFTVALAASAAIVTSSSPARAALTAAFGFETSVQGMAAVGPIQGPVELFHADEATLLVIQTEICFQ